MAQRREARGIQGASAVARTRSRSPERDRGPSASPKLRFASEPELVDELRRFYAKHNPELLGTEEEVARAKTRAEINAELRRDFGKDLSGKAARAKSSTARAETIPRISMFDYKAPAKAQTHSKVPWTKKMEGGIDILRNPKYNKGLAFTYEERFALRIHGLVPPAYRDLNTQAEQVLWNLRRKEDPLDKYQYIMSILDSNERLFYRVVMANVREIMPIVYTPTVGLACQKFGYVFQRPRGMFITIKDRGHVFELLKNWPEDNVRALCFTDGERILGLGDLGAFGMGIPIGKLALYTACAGINPQQLLPVTIDTGTETEELLADPYYVGLKQKRDRSEQYDELIEEFMNAVVRRWGPATLLQFEDFANRNAFRLLEKYKDRFCTFNDDIQGTAAVALAGLFAANRIAGKKMSEQRVLMFGAGSAGLGIANLIVDYIVEDEGLSREEASTRIWLVDSRGLVVKDRSTGGINANKAPFAHPFESEIKDLEEIVRAVKPTCIMGVSAQARVFTPGVLQAMAENTERPIVFPMSNPTSKAECTAAQAFEHTGGKALFASGSPFPEQDVTVDGEVVRVIPSQGNNAYIFPGVALGVLATKATRVPNNFFIIAAKRLADLLSDDDLAHVSLYPSLDRIHWISTEIAITIGEAAYAQGIATAVQPLRMRDLIESVQYEWQKYENYSGTGYSGVSELLRAYESKTTYKSE